jgi:hypothetical protein
VYEYADAEGGDADAQGKKFVINSQVCPNQVDSSIKLTGRTVFMCVKVLVKADTVLM